MNEYLTRFKGTVTAKQALALLNELRNTEQAEAKKKRAQLEQRLRQQKAVMAVHLKALHQALSDQDLAAALDAANGMANDNAVHNWKAAGSPAKEAVEMLQTRSAARNKSNDTRPWKLMSSVPWITAQPASGNLSPGSEVALTLTVRPLDRIAATHTIALVVLEADGALSHKTKVETHVIPAYKPPKVTLSGTAMSLTTLSKELITTHKSVATGSGHRIELARISARYSTIETCSAGSIRSPYSSWKTRDS